MQNFGHEDYNYGGGGGDGGRGFNDGMGTNEGRSLPQVPGARPMVDPEALGEVDPSVYGAPKEATHKIRGKNDFLEYLFGTVDQELLTVKTFYFFFYSAFGSLFPLMGVYFKQMGMNAGQCGLLIGLRPFIEFLSAPFWGSLADRWQKGKIILLASLACWIIFTLPLGFAQPPATSCIVEKNGTWRLEVPEVPGRSKRSVDNKDYHQENNHDNEEENLEVAANVVFERLRRSADDDKVIKKLHTRSNRMRRDSNAASSTTSGSGDNTNLKYKQFVPQDAPENDPMAKEIDFRVIAKQNRPADVLEYKRFLKNEPLDESRPPKKAHTRSKTRSKPVRPKVMVKRQTELQDDFFTGNQDKPYETDNHVNIKVRKYSKAPVYPDDSGEHEKLNDEDEDEEEQQREREIEEEEQEDDDDDELDEDSDEEEVDVPLIRRRRSIRFPHLPLGRSPLPVNFAVNYEEKENKDWVKPQFSSIVYRLPDIQKTFFLLLLLVIVGEFFSAPAITLADSAVITLLGEDADRYGHQRMFGSLGWGLAMFFVGIALDHSTSFPEHPCGPGPKEKNYTICFAIFSVLMGAALITATQINFKYEFIATEPEADKEPAEPTREEQLQSQLSQQLNLPGLQDSSAQPLPKPQPPEGKVLCLGLGGNIIRFLYISWLKNPWWVLPFEFMQGITHAAVWAACCSYIAHNTPPQLRSSAQGVLQGLHHGLGRGCGAVIGGMFVASYGTTATFRAYGLICALVLAAFIFINFYRKDTGFVADLPQTEDPHQVAEATHLAPHGVPSNAIPRALSSSRLHELAQDPGYGATYQTTGGNLNVPGGNGGSNPTNPFLGGGGNTGGNVGGNYNYGRTCKGEDEFIRRSFQIYSEVVGNELDVIKPSAITSHHHVQQPCTNPFHQHDYEW
ncbi:Similar to MFSD6: Major facilitator superfamily domain-containing protein 6 (Homo sapiens) [Cotesia congregata]|uniref:Similar to MFSD6: Major facilitator superfamily domain-containing protein 6 (Homo sapiens) n=1 Tax=Cotesia congregata TaxID=51543 RepID=A0A8J2EH25_COTCN|nr:Similar to MFSD6: Major facilitator superfamily domain-containing protein 6 (Homo sapiens) [Cotesia congregata]